MSNQFLGEIRSLGFNFAPVNWALCTGQTLPISQYSALFSLIGTYYGGNGTTNFQLPNLQGNVPMHWGNGTGLSSYVIGETAGAATVTVATSEMPSHNHVVQVGEGGTVTGTPSPTTWLSESKPATTYVNTGAPNAPLNLTAIGIAGGNIPHDNSQPYLTINFCIAMNGVFPPRG